MGKADEKGLAAISGGQHCRAEFYLKGYGWIPVDPADVAKVRLGEKLSNDDSKLAKVREFLFGNWEMCWIGFNDARDFVLSPKPAEFPLNNFGYPYGEVDDKIVVVPADDRHTGNAYNSLADLPQQLIKQIEFHFNHYKDLKKPGTTKVEHWGDIEEAKAVIRVSQARWKAL